MLTVLLEYTCYPPTVNVLLILVYLLYMFDASATYLHAQNYAGNNQWVPIIVYAGP